MNPSLARIIPQNSTAHDLFFFINSETNYSTDPVGLTGASPTVTISKDGGAFASPAGAVSELANGWYKVAGNATDTNTLGLLLLKATAASGVDCHAVYQVVAFDPEISTNLGLSIFPTTNLVQKIWDALLADLTTAATIGKKLADLPVGADGRVKITSDAHSAGATIAAVTGGVTVTTNNDKTGYALSAGGLTAVENAVWDALLASHVTASTFGAAIQAIADPWNVALPGAYASGKAGYILGTNLNATISSRSSLSSSDVTTAVNTALDAAQVELASMPGVTASLRNKIGFIFQYLHNKRTVTSSTETMFKDDGSTSLGTSTVSNDGTTFTHGKLT